MKRINKFQFVLIWFIIIFGVLVLAINSQANIQYSLEDDEPEGDDDGDDLSKALGLTAIILFGVVVSKALIFFIYKFSRKLDETKESNLTFKNNMKTFFMKTRKPLQWTHYIAGSIAIVLLILHGLSLRTKSLPRTINGIITAIILTFYVLKLKINLSFTFLSFFIFIILFFEFQVKFLIFITHYRFINFDFSIQFF